MQKIQFRDHRLASYIYAEVGLRLMRSNERISRKWSRPKKVHCTLKKAKVAEPQISLISGRPAAPCPQGLASYPYGEYSTMGCLLNLREPARWHY